MDELKSFENLMESVRELKLDNETEQEVQQLVHEEVGDDEEGQQVCPICLDTPDLAEAAAVHGCGHTYCVTCILRWASCKDKGATCPQCKSSFTHVVTHRKPSGTLQDFASNVSVAELLDSCWFAYHKRQMDKGKAPVTPHEHDYDHHEGYDEYDYDYDEDQEVEDFYMSSAAGRARIVLGNRRFGDGGYVSSGRRSARPIQQNNKSAGKKGKATPSPGSQNLQGSHKQVHGTSPGASSAGCTPSPASSSSGRRARRNARRRAMDELHDVC